jgi:hypothetical protein
MMKLESKIRNVQYERTLGIVGRDVTVEASGWEAKAIVATVAGRERKALHLILRFHSLRVT